MRLLRQVVCVAALATLCFTSPAAAQFGGGGGGGGGGQGGGGGGGGFGGGGAGGSQNAGVEIDANGVLRMKTVRGISKQALKRRMAAVRARLNPKVAKKSKLRKISLNRLEAALADLVKKKRPVTLDMRFMVGMTKIQHVFYYPASKDIVIAGPAEAFAPNAQGRVIGMESGQATLELQDLIVALRMFPPGGRNPGLIGCSIDPTKSGLLRMRQFIARWSGRIRPSDDRRYAAGMRDALGMQTVSVLGVSPKTHFAQILVEADYRMKLIGIGLEKPRIGLKSYVARARPSAIARNALQRWYFVPNYECVRVSQDGFSMELVGNGVKLIGEDEKVAADGGRVRSAVKNRASDAFVKAFTKRYPDLARHSPVFGQLKNLIDLTVTAAFIQKQDYYGQSGFKLGVMGNEKALSVEFHRTPKVVPSAVNVVWKGRTLVTPIGGGVTLHPRRALKSDKLLQDDSGKLQQTRKQLGIEGLAKGQWWWD